MRVSKLPLLSAALAVVVALGAARDAAAQVVRWQTPAQAKKDMEKDKKPGIFYFEAPNDPLNHPLQVCFQYPQVASEMKRYVCAKIGASGGGMAGISWSDTVTAKECGVGITTALVMVSYDGIVLDTITSPTDYNDLAVRLGQLADANAERAHKSKESATDLDQVEKWIDGKKYADAVRRALVVVERGDKIDAKVLARANADLDKLKKACTERIAAAKPLADDPTKKAEAKAALKEIVQDFGKLDEAKEATEMLKKLE